MISLGRRPILYNIKYVALIVNARPITLRKEGRGERERQREGRSGAIAYITGLYSVSLPYRCFSKICSSYYDIPIRMLDLQAEASQVRSSNSCLPRVQGSMHSMPRLRPQTLVDGWSCRRETRAYAHQEGCQRKFPQGPTGPKP